MRKRLIEQGVDDAELTALLDRLRASVPDVAAEAVREIEEQLPVFVRPGDPRYSAVLHLAVTWVIGQFLDVLDDDSASLDKILVFYRELGEGVAAERIPQEAWQASFRVGAGVAILRLTELAQTAETITPSVIGQVTQAVLHYIDEVTAAMSQGQARALARGAGGRGERRRALFDALVAPDPNLDGLRDLAVESGWRLPRTAAVVALRRRRDDVAVRPSVPVEALPGLHRDPPCLIVRDPDGPGRRAALAAELRDWVAAVGPAVPVTELERSLRWALRTLEMAADLAVGLDRSVPVLAAEHLPLLLTFTDREVSEHLVAAKLGPLLALPAGQRRRLAETFLTALECGFNATEMARHLVLHAQSVRYRMRQVNALFGAAVHDPRQHLEFALALRYWMATTGEEQE